MDLGEVTSTLPWYDDGWFTAGWVSSYIPPHGDMINLLYLDNHVETHNPTVDFNLLYGQAQWWQ